MFCSKCGAEVKSNEKFCPECGAPNDGYLPLDSAADRKESIKVPETLVSRSSFSVNTIGVISPVVVFLGLFFPLYTSSSSGYTESLNFIKLMFMSGNETIVLILLTFISLVWILLFQLRCHPKISLVGVCVLLVDLIFMIFMYSSVVDWFNVSLGLGFWLFLLGTIGCVVAAFKKGKKQSDEIL